MHCTVVELCIGASITAFAIAVGEAVDFTLTESCSSAGAFVIAGHVGARKVGPLAGVHAVDIAELDVEAVAGPNGAVAGRPSLQHVARPLLLGAAHGRSSSSSTATSLERRGRTQVVGGRREVARAGEKPAAGEPDVRKTHGCRRRRRRRCSSFGTERLFARAMFFCAHRPRETAGNLMRSHFGLLRIADKAVLRKPEAPTLLSS